MGYKEGDVVVCPNKALVKDSEVSIGTVIYIRAPDVLVLDSNGLIHHCQIHEIYPHQSE